MTLLPSELVGALQLKSRARALRVLIWVTTLAVTTYFVVGEVGPLFDREATIARALSSPSLAAAEKEARASITEKGQKRTVYYEFPASELVAVRFQLLAFGDERGPTVSTTAPEVKVRPDRVILWIGIFAVLAAVLITLVPGLFSGRLLGSFRIDMPDRADPKPEVSPAQALPPPSPIDLFSKDVDAAGRRADLLFTRSTLLLAGGIVMAFIGVGIFYVTLPETKGDETLTSYWPKVVRPTGVLIFVEAIAWFLLRQYRSLVEDYKWFYRLYLKRSNYLAAIRLLRTESVRPEELFIAISLVQEDQSGRLKAGETTESLEALRIPEDSPISEALRAFSSLRDKVRPEKGKEPPNAAKSDA